VAEGVASGVAVGSTEAIEVGVAGSELGEESFPGLKSPRWPNRMAAAMIATASTTTIDTPIGVLNARRRDGLVAPGARECRRSVDMTNPSYRSIAVPNQNDCSPA
jgi:hypothetical protein